jgi:hypothetical protein
MRALLLPCLALCSLALSGCSVVYSVHPLSTKVDAVEVPALQGAWTTGKDDDGDLCIQKSDGHAYSMILFDPTSKLTEIYQINLVRLNDQLFADIVFDKETVDRTEIEPPLGSITNHVIVKLEITENDITYSALDSSAIRNLSQQGYTPLDFLDVNEGILLTTSTDDLRQYLSLYSDRVFTDPEHYKRKINDETGAPVMACSVPTPPQIPPQS